MIKKEELHKFCQLMYGIFVLGILTQFFMTTFLFGMLVMTMAIIMLHAAKSKSLGTVHESHIQWLIRTFWIGGGVYLPIATVIAFCLIYPNMDMNALYDAVGSGQITDPEQMADAVMAQNKLLFSVTFAATALPFLGWWYYRCWKGYRLLKAQQPVPDVMSWV